MAQKRIIYARGFPYGAPMVWLRGGGIRDEAVKDYLRGKSFWWNPTRHARESAMYKDEFRQVLIELRDMGYEVIPKVDMNPEYVIDLN